MIRLIVFSLFTLLAGNFSWAQSPKDYLASNAQPINLAQPDFGFSPDFYANQVYLFGFVHGSATPQLIDYELLRDLNTKGVRYYAPEVGYSQAYFFNQYLETGNLKALEYACHFYQYMVPQDASVDFYEKWQKIRAYNQTLPSGERITVLGFDVTPSDELMLTHLAFLAPEAPKGNTLVDSLHFFRNYDRSTVSIMSGKPAWKSGKGWMHFFGTEKQAFYGRLMAAYEKDSTAVLEAFGTAAPAARRVLNNRSVTNREAYIFNQFKTYGSPLLDNGEKIYMNYGYFHVQQQPINNFPPLAARIKDSTSFSTVSLLGMLTESSCTKGSKLKSTGPLYVKGVKFKGSRYNGYRQSRTWDGDSFFEKAKGIHLLEKAAGKHPVTLFSLTEKNSPFTSGQYFAHFSRGGRKWKTEPEAVTTDYFQYIFLIRKSPAAVPVRSIYTTEN